MFTVRQFYYASNPFFFLIKKRVELVDYRIPECKVEKELQFEVWLLDDREGCKGVNEAAKARNTECHHKVSAFITNYM